MGRSSKRAKKGETMTKAGRSPGNHRSGMREGEREGGAQWREGWKGGWGGEGDERKLEGPRSKT